MPGRPDRRRLLAALAAGALPLFRPGSLAVAATRRPAPRTGADRRFRTAIAALEAHAGGRLGLSVLLPASGRRIGWRGGERFGLCSTFKLALAAQALHADAQGRLPLSRRLPYGPADLVTYAPVTGMHVAEGAMSVADLCDAAIRTSDNVAANLLLAQLGGPAGFTAWMRSLGDSVTRLDANEPALNFVLPGTLENTTAPDAMARSVARLFAADGPLTAQARTRLADWLRGTQTGLKRLRAGFPAGWDAGDKTGSASDSRPGPAAGKMVNKYNDVATVWLPSGQFAVVAAYYDAAIATPALRPEDEAVLARAGGIAAHWIGERT